MSTQIVMWQQCHLVAIIVFGITNVIFAVCLDQWPFKVPVLLRLGQDEDFGNLDFFSSSSSFIF